MPDKNLKIEIQTTADLSGVKQTADGLKKLADSSKTAAASTKELGTSSDALGKFAKDSLDPALANLTDSLQEETVATGKSIASKRQLQDAAKGLATQFPLLGSVARMALNPITASVAAIAGAFALWNLRVKEAERTLGGFELPDLSKLDPGLIASATEANLAYAKSLAAVLDQYNSLDAAFDRYAKQITAQAAREKALAEARKGYEMATARTAEEKLEIEDRYAAAGVSADLATRKKLIENTKAAADSKRLSAALKAREAAGIHIATAERDQANEADLKAEADAAQKDIDERKTRKEEAQNDNGWGLFAYFKNPVAAYRNFYRYGGMSTQDEAVQFEQQGIERQQSVVDRYNNFLSSKSGRSQMRDRRGRLISESGTELGQAAVLNAQYDSSVSEFSADSSNQAEIARLNALARAATLQEAKRKELDAIQEKFLQAVAAGQQSQIDALSAKLRQLEAGKQSAASSGAF